MDTGIRTFIIADWIFIIGITPLAYFIAFLIIFGGFLESIINNILIIYFIGFIGLFITFIFIVKNKIIRNKRIALIKKTNDNFLLGVFFIYLGHLGLIAIYALGIYAEISPGGTISGLFIAPAIPWMSIFYFIGYIKTTEVISPLSRYKRIKHNKYEETNNLP